MNKIRTYTQALEEVFDFEFIKDYSLIKIQLACEKLGNPQNAFQVVHVAGTNWKWSVCKMVFWVIKNAGKKVWVFTSPHIHDIRERFETDAWVISKDDFVEHLNTIMRLGIKLAYFEKCFLIALLHFKKQNCEFAIIETWVWGRLDSTNIVQPVITCITSIWLDHQDLLWDTIDDIVYEKAGIIKPGVPIIVNIKNNIIKEKSEELGAPLLFTQDTYKTNLSWEFQLKNAWLAYRICSYLWFTDWEIQFWLHNVEHKWRMHWLSENCIVDGAHNEDGLLALRDHIRSKYWNKFTHISYCFSLKKWKKIEDVVSIFWKNEDYILIDCKLEILKDMSEYTNTYEVLSIDKLKVRMDNNKNRLFVIFWSLYMIWEFLK